MGAAMAVDDEQEQRQWRINVHAKSRNFSLRIRATAAPSVPPKPHALSALFRLRGGSVLKVESSSGRSHHSRRRHEIVRSLFRRLFSRSRMNFFTPKQGGSAEQQAQLLRTPLSRLRQLAREDPVGTWSVFIAVFILGAFAATALRGAIATATGAYLPIPLVAALLLLLSPWASSAFNKFVTATGLGGNRFYPNPWLILPSLLVILVILGGYGSGKQFDFSKDNLVRCLWNALRSKLTV